MTQFSIFALHLNRHWSLSPLMEPVALFTASRSEIFSLNGINIQIYYILNIMINK